MTNYLSVLVTAIFLKSQFFLPIGCKDRQDVSKISLTEIGQFGLIRKARPGIPGHFHTGIDLKRPVDNYLSEPIFPIAKGIVISKRIDGPYANLIVEHELNGRKLWSLYEHIAGIKVKVSDLVDPKVPIARFMNKKELDHYGWQFDHVHFELLKVKPIRLKPEPASPERFYKSYTLICHNKQDINTYYIDPMVFFKESVLKTK